MAERSQTADEVARQRAEAAQAAQYAQLAAEEAARQRAIQGYSQAAAQMVAPIAGQVQQGYADAGQRTANYAKGFSIGFNQAVSGNADQANAYLAKQGSPQHVQSQGAPGADVIYGTGGYIPASTLEREGAAFSSAARMLPSTQLGYGAQALSQMQQDVAGRRAALDANRPALEAQFRQQIFENNLARQKFAEEKRQANLTASTQSKATKVQADYLKNAQRSQAFQEAVGYTNQTGNLYYVDKNGQVQIALNAKGKPIKATGSDSYGQVAQATAARNAATAKVTAAAKTAKQKKADARATAIAKKNDKTVAALSAAEEWVDTQLKPGTKVVPVPGRGTPKEAYTRTIGTGAAKQTIQYYVAKPGYIDPTTHKPSSVTVDPNQAMMDPVTQTVPIPKAEYQKIRRQLITKLTQQLGRFGYKPYAIANMASEILDDRYTITERIPPTPGPRRTTTRPGRPDRRGGP